MGFKKNTPGFCCCGSPAIYVVRDDYVHLCNSDGTLEWTETLPSSLILTPADVTIGCAENRDLQLVAYVSGDFGESLQYELDGTLHQTDVDAHIAAGYSGSFDSHAKKAAAVAHDGLICVWEEREAADVTNRSVYYHKLVRGSWSGTKALVASGTQNYTSFFACGLPDGSVCIVYIDDSGDAKLWFDGAENDLGSTPNAIKIAHLYDQSTIITEITTGRKRRRFDDDSEYTGGSWPVNVAESTDAVGLGLGYWAHNVTRDYEAAPEFSGSLLSALGADNSAANDLMLKRSASKDVANNELDVDYQDYLTGATSTSTYSGDGSAVLTAGESTPWVTSVYEYRTDP